MSNCPTWSRISTAICAARRFGSGQGRGSLKKTMMASPAKPLHRPLIFVDDGTKHGMILLHDRHSLLGLGQFGERGNPTQVAEDDGNRASMAFQHVIIPRREDELRNLGRQESLQAVHAL